MCLMCHRLGSQTRYNTAELRPSLPYQDMTREKFLVVTLLLFIIVQFCMSLILCVRLRITLFPEFNKG